MNQKLFYPFEDISAEGEAIEVADGILWVRLPLPMALDHVNVFALDDGDSWTLIDTGFHSKRGIAIWEKLFSGPLKGKPVGRVLVTHHHPDHVGAAGWFQTAHGAELLTTRLAWYMARMLTLDDQPVPTDEAISFYRSAGMPEAMIDERRSQRPFNFADMVAPIPQGFTRIQEADVVHAAGRDWTVHIGHGHAPEHASLWNDEIVLGGDQLLPSISPNLGVYPNEPMADPVAEWLTSCAHLKQYATPEQLVLPGHKLPFKGLPFRLDQLIENHHGALSRLIEHLDSPKSAHECFLPLFKREISGGEYGLALSESVAHLNHLYLAGQAHRYRDENGVYRYTKA